MKKLYVSIALLLMAVGQILANEPQVVLDSNTAFYEGESLRYIVSAPKHFRMVTDEAEEDGYSFAFIPKSDSYDSASVVIGVNIYKIRGIPCDSVITSDTAALRQYYGPHVAIREVASLATGSGEQARTFYLETSKGFLPNAVMAYYDGKTEIFIFELVLTPDVIRFKAEELFSACVKSFRTMKRGTLGQK